MLSQGVTNLSVLCEGEIEDLCCVLNVEPKDGRGAVRLLACMNMKPAIRSGRVCVSALVWVRKRQRGQACLFIC